MKKIILTGILALAAGVSSIAQQGAPAPAQGAPAPAQGAQPAPAAPTGPMPKSQDELQAVRALYAAQNDPDITIKTAEDLLSRFADTQLKEMALFAEAEAYQRKGDNVKAQVFAERVLEVNPKNMDAHLLLGEVITVLTSENALTKDEQLASAEKHLTFALEALGGATKPNPAIPDEQWADYKKMTGARIHQDFGMLALRRKDYNKAIEEFKTALASDPEQQAYEARLAAAYQAAGKNAEAIQVCDRMLAKPDLNPTIKQFVNTVKAAASKQPAAAPAAPAVPPAK